MAKQPEQILAEQTKIANFITAIDEKINHCQVQISKTEVWKKGIVTGNVCVICKPVFPKNRYFIPVFHNKNLFFQNHK